MKRNPLIPFALIAIIGILAVIVISFIGVGQRNDIASEGEEPEQAEEGGMEDPEEIFASSCVSCHGADLSGGFGPNLQTVGANLSVDEIKDVITNGRGDMPPQGHLSEGEISIISEWLSEKK
ncbi:cytochrome c550 [Ornithinibacillus contaminans]|uniref:cytochrome c550 n=1 Tax=Ornithinibacillus contaminans TaxID=694055 RepID=UPI00064DE6EB|nr:cytochrome c [Ornithinibacillus contaminans]